MNSKPFTHKWFFLFIYIFICLFIYLFVCLCKNQFIFKKYLFSNLFSYVLWHFILRWHNYMLLVFEWMKHLYSALLCMVVHPKRFTIMWGVSPQPPPVCSIYLDDAMAATVQRRQCAHHTPATGGEEREIEPIKWMGIIRRPLKGPVEGIWPGHRGYNPTPYDECHHYYLQ